MANIDGTPKQAIVRMAIKAVSEMVHRGSRDADAKTGDGAGVLTQLPHGFFRLALNGTGLEVPD
ncbi:hypothetical protein RZS08_37510, partial [Arthrospira platensis SPKY1]|nr:hypothetical protein [Arthrospira platensis SPKY1]